MPSVEDWIADAPRAGRGERFEIPVPELLTALGIKGKHTGSKWRAICPNPNHDDHDPSWSIIDRPGEKKNGSHHCFSCGWGGGPWELASAVWACTVDEAGERLRALFEEGKHLGPVEVPGVRVELPTARVVFSLPIGAVIPEAGGKWYGPARAYLDGRGVTEGQIQRWGIGYAIRGRLRNRVVFPVWTEGKLRTYSARAIDPSMDPRYDAGKVHLGAEPDRALWGEPRWDLALGVVVVAEGIPSALALERVGAPNPSAMLGSNLTPDRARLLSKFPRVLIATDPDKAGDACAQWIQVLGRRARVARLSLRLSPDDMPAEELGQCVKEGLTKLFG